MKKFFWFSGLGIVAAVAPLAVISCASSKTIGATKVGDPTKSSDTSSDGLRDFNSITADGIEWNKGVAWHAVSQGTSVIWNMAKILGWKDQPDIGSSPLLDALHQNSVSQPVSNYYIDPMGSNGTLEFWMLDSLNFNAEEAFGRFIGSGEFSKNILIRNYSIWIDGTKNDGRVIVKIIADSLGEQYKTGPQAGEFIQPVRTYESLPHTIRTYPIIEQKQLQLLQEQIFAAIKNLQSKVIPNVSSISPDFNSLLNFIHDTKITKEQSDAALAKLNNGSHHLEALSVFLSGLKNIPIAERPWDPHRPSGGQSYTDYTANGTLKGLMDIDNLTELSNWAHIAYVNEHVYVKAPST